jgi:anaerobic magnesium-protoporphyrin IX monomethyl ester cyclase
MRVLIVDLNNFARYPTVAVGYLVAILRQAGIEATVFSPLASGVTGVVREPPVKPWGLIDQRLRYWSAVSTNPLVRNVRARVAAMHGPKLKRHTDRVFDEFQRCLHTTPSFDVVLISTYLMYYDLCAQMCSACRDAGVPAIVGGSYFSQPEVIEEWIGIDGLTALVGGEVEPDLVHIVHAAAAGESLHDIPGVFVPGAPAFVPAPPLRDLDALPFADYSDFPWERYPNRLIPLISGRGCGWGACTFCSDVTSTAGRTFRSRSPDNVLAEISHQSQRHDAKLFVFTDLKLNSSLAMWEALIRGFPSGAPGARWVASVHVGSTAPNGLSRSELQAARAAGLVRLTTGLESGSQRMLDRMAKGADLAVTSRFLRDASDAGISMRTTMVLGYPGEQAEDVDASAAFVEQHADCIERVSLNRFLIMTGTRIHRQLERSPQSVAHNPNGDLMQLTVNHRVAQVSHHYRPSERPEYRRAVTRLLRAVHAINRRPLREAASAFEGVM